MEREKLNEDPNIFKFNYLGIGLSKPSVGLYMLFIHNLHLIVFHNKFEHGNKVSWFSVYDIFELGV